MIMYATLVEPVIKIYGAFYGDKNVKSIIEGRIMKNSLEINACNDIFGDPWFGTVKTLSVFYTYGSSRMYVEVVKEGQNLIIFWVPHIHTQCEVSPKGPTALAAVYGDKDVTLKACKLMTSGTPYLTTNNEKFEDTMPGIAKTLAIAYVDSNGFVRIACVKEGQAISLI